MYPCFDVALSIFLHFITAIYKRRRCEIILAYNFIPRLTIFI
ncbi:hypothetical protein HMPREF2111_02133 [Staphylococcus aureus 917]|nr:hypothetical protein CGSSa01_06547 [Staphylococcus aureus subsp. aureus CGS01]KIE14673.1 hypothetical protein HMPREF2111_02133 [Staphylococcus aureus 917]BAB95611.1 hypothetical protein [Staphylococcus aureus subsp. aureus MW2]